MKFDFSSAEFEISEFEIMSVNCCGCGHDGLQAAETTETKIVLVKTLDRERTTVKGL